MDKLVIDDDTGLVENLIAADDTFSLLGKTLIEYTGQANIGMMFNGSSFLDVLKTQKEIDEENAIFNDQVDAALFEADLKIIRALVEGDEARINSHKSSQASLRASKK